MKFNIMDQTGHTTIEIDKSKSADIEMAMAKFAELTGPKKMRAAVPAGDGSHTIVKSFDPDAEEYIFVPPLVGG